MTETVGEIGECWGEIEFQWRIADIEETLRLEHNIEFLKSPNFSFLEFPWHLMMKIREYGRRPAEWLALYLMRGDSGPPVTLTYALGIKTSDGRKDKRCSGTALFDRYTGRGSPTFLLSSDILTKNSDVARSGFLVVVCSLKKSHPDVVSRTEKLSRDLLELLATSADSDVTFSVKGMKFPAHRNILGARSPVFASMFKHEMTEKATGVVEIGDCEASTFRVFLGYLYGGRVEHPAGVDLVAVYRVADKYHVDELKEDCLECMKSNLAVDVFCDFLALGLRHDEKELVALAVEYFAGKREEIVQTAKWKAFLSENPAQANELLGRRPS